jgi:hypothetical protein
MPQAHGTPFSLSAATSAPVKIAATLWLAIAFVLSMAEDFAMGMRRAQEQGMKLPRANDVVDIAPAAGQETPVFAAANRHPDSVFCRQCRLTSALPHCHLTLRGVAAPAQLRP